jgi:hypothetical protein
MPRSLAKLINRIVPRAVLKPFSLARRHDRQVERDRELTALHAGFDLTRITGQCTLLPDRTALLQRLPRNAVCAEVGVAQGEFSAEILAICSPVELHLIDLWSGASSVSGKIGASSDLDAVRRKFSREIGENRVLLHRGTSWEMLEGLQEGSLDWVYIDAAHDFPSVQRDLSVASRKVRSDGLICGHDYTRWGSTGMSRFGVVEAVNLFCDEEGWEMAYLTNEPNRHCSFALKRRRSEGVA